MNHTSNGPLQGLRVIELASYVAGPLGGLTLAQLGADVLRVDPLGGSPDRHRWPLAPSGASLYWTGLNRGKRSIALDLRAAQGRRLLAELVAGAGTVLTNAGSRPGQRYEDLRATRDDLIYVQVAGARGGRGSVDYTADAAAGFPLATGTPETSEPTGHVLPAWDVACGLYAAVGLLAAQHDRTTTGRGAHLVIGLDDVALATAGNLGYLAEAELTGVGRPRVGNAVYGTYGHAFATRDGHLMIVALTARHWNDLLTTTGLTAAAHAVEAALGTDFTREEERYRHQRLLDALLQPWFAARSTAEAEAALRPTSVLWSRFRTFREIVTDGRDELLAGPLFDVLDQPGVGPHLAPGSPITGGGRTLGGPHPAPCLGQHTREVLTSLGRTPADIDQLIDSGTVA
ncbi:CoA transferase [Dactylosporangium sp. NBC_01737]|uniref:CoA transferase n=1 Tax=Dactylosporangium sp. NBC_01737 TaxID=2975959 RepID=UPI002E1408BC|nr:CoA transferase [Dactylosporangium sp. NBC_01737]